jgi:hypothetical protein
MSFANHFADGCNVFPFAYGVNAESEFVGTPD